MIEYGYYVDSGDSVDNCVSIFLRQTTATTTITNTANIQ